MIFVFLSTSFCSWLFLFFLIPQLRRRLLDRPNIRSSHTHPTPLGGGLSFVLFTFVSSCISLFCGDRSSISVIPLLATPLAIVGLLDDRYNLPVFSRFCVHLLTGVAILGISSFAQSLFSSIFAGSLYLVPFILFLVVVVISLINFINFMDGLDGLVAGCMLVAIVVLSFILHFPWCIWTLCGSLFGFLLWNWSPAQVFMGDVGSTFLGAVFAGLVFQATSWADSIAFLLLATPLLADACFCVARRVTAGQRVFQPHRLHLFQRLHQCGWSHSTVSMTYITATAVLGVAMLAGGLLWVLGLVFVEILIGVWLDQYVAVPFAVASRN